MTTENCVALFEKYGEEHLKFADVENKLSQRPDLHAFLLLDKLVPGKSDMVSAAEHDEIYLDVSFEKLADLVSEAEIRDLCRCGVRFNSEYECLFMFA